jgi:pSer/pThr/pTyr-binding forkhead associated (FHA) protein
MNGIDSWLSRLEARLQSLVEGTADRLLPPGEEKPGEPAQAVIEHTAPIQVDSETAHATQPVPAGAFLVVDGVRLFPLERGVISIGRDPQNDLVLADRRVSRQHAQLRAVGGRFVVFDLDSTGGTSLNGRPVTHQPLSPGDVLSLAGVPLVYGQESPAGSEHTQEISLGDKA